MKKLLTAFCLFVFAGAPLLPAKVAVVHGRVPVSDLNVARSQRKLMLSMDLDVSDFRLGKDRQLMIIPVIHNADSTESYEFHPVYVAGHNLYFKHLRDNDLQSDTYLYKEGRIATLRYTGDVPDAKWIDDSRLSVYYRIGGCCDVTVEEGVDLLAPLRKPVAPVYKPRFNYVTPVGDTVKTRELKKTAYIDFPVDQTIIYPDYRRNTVELAKIQNTIDSVRDDKDITITAVALKGFASPESPYKHNTDLAIGRTAALKNYIQQLYRFPEGVITTSYEPEDWDGLRRYVEQSNIDNRDAILAVIDSDMAPDPKEARIKAQFPEQYRFMLQNWYPALRHTDYKIDYKIRQYTTLEEILRILAEAPRKLSLNEFFRAAQSMTPGSTEYNNVFETAVRMYPASETANLNAANASMARGDYDSAERYLERAGDDASAIYARGILAALREDYESAEALFSSAARLKVADAPAALDEVRAILEWHRKQADPDNSETYIKLN